MALQIKDNIFVKAAYKTKFYITVARGQWGWLTGWLPEIASVLGLIWYFTGYKMSVKEAIIITPIVIVLLAVFGFVWYKLGLYNIEIMVNVGKDPYQSEVYNASKKINNSKRLL